MFFWSRFPFVRVVLFFVLGILPGIYLPGFDTLVIISLAISITALVFLVFKRKSMMLRFNHLYGIILSLVFIFIGYTMLQISTETHSQNHLIHFDRGNYYTGKIISDPQIKGDYIRLKIDVRAIKDSAWHEASGKVLVYLKRPVVYMPGYGDKLLLKGVPQKVSPPLNPHEFDYGKYLAYNNIHHQHFISSENWYLQEQASGISVRRMSINARKYLEAKLTLFISQPEELSVAKALILGSASLTIGSRVGLGFSLTPVSSLT